MKKRYNWKAREVVKVQIDDSEKNQLKVAAPAESSNYDASNEFALPATKRKTKIKNNHEKITRILSHKHRKRLEKVVERRKKKENRASLLEALTKVQATPEELKQLVSITAVQTKGLKKLFHEQRFPEKVELRQHPTQINEIITEASAPVLNSLAGSKRKRIALLNRNSIKVDSSSDPNVVGFDDSSDIDDSADEDDDVVEADCDDAGASKKSKLQQDSVNIAVEEQRDEAIPVSTIDAETSAKKSVVRTVIKPSRPATFVDVVRTAEVQAARLKLPILAEEQQIMEVINENDIIIIAGETGSGKTTQVPQFLYEAGYAERGTIAVTEPRRVAAVAMSRRVASEMSLGADQVSYLIRFEGNATDDTCIKFMTDGVLLKELQNDFLLTRYSVVILDEAHERSAFTDILIGLLSRIVPLRNRKCQPLKLIIMSATLRLSDFTENRRLFKAVPPVIKVDARQFSVTMHFNKRTEDDYLDEAYKKVCRIHNTLPEGGVLVFVTGQAEVNTLVRKLRRTYPLKENTHVNAEDVALKEALRQRRKLTVAPRIDLDDYSLPGDMEIDDEEALDDDEGNAEDDTDAVVVNRSQPMWVLPLYSMLPAEQQAQVFVPAPVGCRLCVVATNVAETSLTIPGVRYVVDSGRTKRRLFDRMTGVSRYMVMWTSKASAEQRAGRAGRTGPGHCYRLYSSAVFNDMFAAFAEPEIQQRPVDDLYLQMRCMGVDRVINFPFPTAPDLMQLKSAEYRLGVLGALTMRPGSSSSMHNSESAAPTAAKEFHPSVTDLGRAISRFPLLPRYGKMLALSHQHALLPYTICLVAALSVPEVLLEVPVAVDEGKGDVAVTTANGAGATKTAEGSRERCQWRQVRQHWVGTGNGLLLGDAMVLLKAVGGAEYANSLGQLETFCADNGLRLKALMEIRKLRLQLSDAIATNVRDSDVCCVDPQLSPPTDTQAKLLRQILLAGMGDQVAHKVSLAEVKHLEDRQRFKYAYRVNGMEEPVHLHGGSVLRRTLPEWVVYQEVYETDARMYMRGVTAVEPEWLATYVPALCHLSEPVSDPPPRYIEESGKVMCTVAGTFGAQAWPLVSIDVEYPATDAASYCWFARFLLEGTVCPSLARYATSLLAQPVTVTRQWARLQPRVAQLVQQLMSQDCRSRRRLLELWDSDPKYLLADYLKWLPESAYEEVRLIWPPIK